MAYVLAQSCWRNLALAPVPPPPCLKLVEDSQALVPRLLRVSIERRRGPVSSCRKTAGHRQSTARRDLWQATRHSGPSAGYRESQTRKPPRRNRRNTEMAICFLRVVACSVDLSRRAVEDPGLPWKAIAEESHPKGVVFRRNFATPVLHG